MQTHPIRIAFFLVCFLANPCFAAQFIIPHEVGGFVLGESIHKFKDQVNLSSRMKVRYQEFLSEVEINPLKHYKSGLISVGNCSDPGKIVQIKLKYADFSKEFYQELLKRFKARFGLPRESKDDPLRLFNVSIWHFFDENQNQIDLILQHNIQAETETEKRDNVVKMILVTQMEKEQGCLLEKKRRTDPAKAQDESRKMPSLIIDWDLLIPK
jgi:hypothetical protein